MRKIKIVVLLVRQLQQGFTKNAKVSPNLTVAHIVGVFTIGPHSSSIVNCTCITMHRTAYRRSRLHIYSDFPTGLQKSLQTCNNNSIKLCEHYNRINL